MKVRLLKDIAGSSKAGSEYDLDKYVAELMIKKGEAEEITQQPKKRGRKKKEEQ